MRADVRVARPGARRSGPGRIDRLPSSLLVEAPTLPSVLDRHLRTNPPWTVGLRTDDAGAAFHLGAVQRLTGRYVPAVKTLTLAFDHYEARGDPLGRANCLAYRGAVRRLLGEYDGAGRDLTDALALYSRMESRHGQAGTLLQLGVLSRQTNDHPAAETSFDRALRFYDGLGDHHGRADVLLEVGIVRRLASGRRAAQALLTQALLLYEELGARRGQAAAHRELGRNSGAPEEPAPLEVAAPAPETGHEDAGTLVADTLRAWERTGEPGGRMWLLRHLGVLAAALGESELAARRFTEARALARALDSPWDEEASQRGLDSLSG